MPTAADIRRRNDAFQAKAGTRQPAKRSTVDRKAKEAGTAGAAYTKWLAIALVALLSGGFFLQILYMFFGDKKSR